MSYCYRQGIPLPPSVSTANGLWHLRLDELSEGFRGLRTTTTESGETQNHERLGVILDERS